MLEAIEFSAGEAVAAALVLFVASYVRGLTGFGFSAVFVAVATFFIEPSSAVPLALMYEVVASVFQAPGVRSEIRWRTLTILTGAAVVGNPIGLAILSAAEPDVLRAVVYATLLVLTLLLVRSGAGSIELSTMILFGVGVVAGVVNGATALSGLVLVVAMSFMTVTTFELRATLVAYFFVSNLFAVSVLAWRSDLGEVDLWRATAGLPILAVGVAVGSHTFRGLDPAAFRRVTVFVLIALASAGMARLGLGLLT